MIILLGNFSKKPFDIIDFGLCYLDDLIGELKDNKEIVIDHEHGMIRLYRKGSKTFSHFPHSHSSTSRTNRYRKIRNTNLC